ncbi:MAG: COX15/CtaA family protein [Bacteroidota bacterium]
MQVSLNKKPVIVWLLSGCFIIYVMVVVGCITRLTHSGLSMTHWSITGSLPPLNDADWKLEFEKYSKSPEFNLINSGMTVEDFKSIYWWEWVHRFIGRGVLSGTFFIGFLWLYFTKKLNKRLVIKSGILMCLGAAQGLIGWWMVKSGLVDNPAVSHFRLAIHLMSAFTCFAVTFWFALQLLYGDDNESVEPEIKIQNKKLYPYALILFFVFIAQIVFGAFVAGLKAGRLLPTWPKMGDTWYPKDLIEISNSWAINFFENEYGVQFIHRTFAFIVVVMVCVVWIKSNKLKLSKRAQKGVTFIIYGTTIQFILGVWTLLYQVPVVLGVLHQTGAFFLFAATLYLLFHLSFKKKTENQTISAEVQNKKMTVTTE